MDGVDEPREKMLIDLWLNIWIQWASSMQVKSLLFFCHWAREMCECYAACSAKHYLVEVKLPFDPVFRSAIRSVGKLYDM